MDASKKVEISAVVPVFNEEKNLIVLIPKLLEVLNQLSKPYEVIFVDDGSSDGIRKILKEMASQCPTLREVTGTL
jgi:glycosyltransferase involved in cell wall biosynthesis